MALSIRWAICGCLVLFPAVLVLAGLGLGRALLAGLSLGFLAGAHAAWATTRTAILLADGSEAQLEKFASDLPGAPVGGPL